MRKNDLINILEAIEGNPEIHLWNGYVQDYQPIGNVHAVDLYKYTKEHYIEMCRLEKCIDKQDWNFQFTEDMVEILSKNFDRVCKWEMNGYVTEDDIKSKRWKRKKVYLISPKLRGERSMDRIGVVEY